MWKIRLCAVVVGPIDVVTRLLLAGLPLDVDVEVDSPGVADAGVGVADEPIAEEAIVDETTIVILVAEDPAAEEPVVDVPVDTIPLTGVTGVNGVVTDEVLCGEPDMVSVLPCELGDPDVVVMFPAEPEDPDAGLEVPDSVELLLLDPDTPLVLDGSPDTLEVLGLDPLEAGDETEELLDVVLVGLAVLVGLLVELLTLAGGIVVPEV